VAIGTLSVIGGALPGPLFVAVSWLAAAGVARPAATPWLVLGPSALVLFGAICLAALEGRAVAGARRQLRARRGRPEATARLVEPWYASFDSARGAQPLGRGRLGWARVGLAGAVAAIVTAAAVVVLVPVWLVGVVGARPAVSWPFDTSQMNNKWRIAELLRPFALPADSAITALQAGRALWALLGSEPTAIPEKAPPPALDSLPAPRERDSIFVAARTRGPGASGWPSDPWPDGRIVIEMAARDRLSRAEFAYLERLAAHPRWQAFSTVARAAAVDLWGARFRLPFPRSVTVFDIPIPRYGGVKDLARVNTLRAALRLARGDRAGAERILRETISFGLRLTNGNWLIEQLIGAVVVGRGRGDLQQFYALTGRPEAAVIKAQYDSAAAAFADRPVTAEVRLDERALFRALARIVRDSTALRGVRVEALNWLGYEQCTNARELLFGMSPELDSLFRWSRRTLARYPSEAAWVDLARETPERYPRQGLSGFGLVIQAGARAAGVLLANPRLRGCTEILQSR
jgi:hypothetical protein